MKSWEKGNRENWGKAEIFEENWGKAEILAEGGGWGRQRDGCAQEEISFDGRPQGDFDFIFHLRVILISHFT